MERVKAKASQRHAHIYQSLCYGRCARGKDNPFQGGELPLKQPGRFLDYVSERNATAQY